MPFVRLPNGMTAHVRMAAPRRRRCSACKLQTVPAKLRLCDFVLQGGKTCDALICTGCATHSAPDKDLCPAHRWTEIDDLFDRTDWEPRP